ncbi:MAG: DNA methyltransferase [Planctomycetota bacterium]
MPVTPDADRTQRLTQFVAWADQYITGDEKGQAQVFLDHLFQAFGQPGVLDVGANYEERIKKTQGGTAFADLVWKPHVLIEMKKRGVDLATAYQQAFDYWTRLVPGRPNYVVLCNFDEFWIYDFDVQVDTPVDKVLLKDLPQRYGPLAFLYPTEEEPTFGNNNEKVTREAADHLATLFNKLIDPKRKTAVDRATAQRFVLQCLVALFAEDIDLLPRYFFTQLLEKCDSPEKAYDLIGGLFTAMNTPGETTGGQFKGVKYFNGGVFAEPTFLELQPDELQELKDAAVEDWSKVRPEIFGTIFEHSLDQKQRHAQGAHFTAGVDIQKIIKPTITDPWEKAIAKANSLKALRELHQRMQAYRVLDPACGSGNFLYLAYRQLKRLERQLLDKLNDVSKRQSGDQMQFSFVTARQFFGMDINPFAVELAKVTMMIARKLAIEELHMDEDALPLDNLDDNFRACDALIVPSNSLYAPQADDETGDGDAFVQTRWPDADVIIGNPPFLGAKRMKPELGADYVNAVRKLYPEVPGMADFCVYWFRRAHDHLPACTPDDPVSGRAGLVGTQNIRNNKSREGGLDHIVATGGVIVDAMDNWPWSGEANVHVSIANWVKRDLTDEGVPKHDDADLYVPPKRTLWFKLENTAGKKKVKRGSGSESKQPEPGQREATYINASLSDQIDLTTADAIIANKKPQVCFQGVVLGYDGFAVTHVERSAWIKADARNAEVVRPWLIGRDMLTGDGSPSRSVIDFADRDMLEARSYEDVFARLQTDVLPDIREKAINAEGGSMEDARKDHLDRWWQFWNVRTSMRQTFEPMSRFLGMSRTTKRPIICFVSTKVCPDSKIQTFALEDDYSFGVMHSDTHWQWFIAICAKLEARPSYSSRTIFDTFPWPQGPNFRGPTVKQIDAVAAAGRKVRAVRDEALTNIKGGLRAVYRTLELPGKNPLKDAHAALDAAVLDAYGFSKKKDLLQQLLDLNHAVAEREKNDQPVVAPGIPASFTGDRAALVTDDCIRP